MKWYHATLILLAVLAVVFGTLYFTHPRIKIVGKPIPCEKIIYAKPDTVYIIKYKLKQVEVPRETTISLDTTQTEVDTTVSEVILNQQTLLGRCENFIQVKSEGNVFSIGARPSFPEAQEAIENIRHEIMENIKPQSKFWFGFSVGASVITALTITTLLITK